MKKLAIASLFCATNVFAASNSISATAQINAVCQATVKDWGTVSEVIFADTDVSDIIAKVSTIEVDNNTTNQTRLTINSVNTDIPNFNGGLGIYRESGQRVKASSVGGSITFDSSMDTYKNGAGQWYIGVYDLNKTSELPRGTYETTVSFTITCF